ncbi:hypothetical protein ACET3X_007878 [Alternaria dauci]|uniref:Uncharacterized protein n=1 Tax=Alternaria dauci TaxID=48095 RepID=A0ABR3UE48_9PLEO
MEEITAIPVGFPESDARAVPLERRSQRKCLLNLNRRRAFWTHSLNECWIPYSERPKRPKDPIEWPIEEIDPPKCEDEDESNGYVPTIGIPVYRARLYDHYGLMYPNTSPSEDWKRQQWPRIGIRVPYEPMTIEDLRVRGADDDAMAIDPTTRPAREVEHGGGARDNDMGTEGYNELSDTPDPTDSAGNKRRKLGTILAPDADKRALYEVRSMAVPVIATPQRPWAPLKDDRADEYHGDGYDSDDNGSETDNDGDLFFKSYETGCFPNGRPAPIVPPVTSAEDHEPGTAPEDVQLASAASEVVMTEAGDDADL